MLKCTVIVNPGGANQKDAFIVVSPLQTVLGQAGDKATAETIANVGTNAFHQGVLHARRMLAELDRILLSQVSDPVQAGGNNGAKGPTGPQKASGGQGAGAPDQGPPGKHLGDQGKVVSPHKGSSRSNTPINPVDRPPLKLGSLSGGVHPPKAKKKGRGKGKGNRK